MATATTNHVEASCRCSLSIMRHPYIASVESAIHGQFGRPTIDAATAPPAKAPTIAVVRAITACVDIVRSSKRLENPKRAPHAARVVAPAPTLKIRSNAVPSMSLRSKYGRQKTTRGTALRWTRLAQSSSRSPHVFASPRSAHINVAEANEQLRYIGTSVLGQARHNAPCLDGRVTRSGVLRSQHDIGGGQTCRPHSATEKLHEFCNSLTQVEHVEVRRLVRNGHRNCDLVGLLQL